MTAQLAHDPRSTVILFKTPVKGGHGDSRNEGLGDDDPYAETLRQGGFEPAFVPVLQEEYHLDEVCAVLQSDEEWEGVVVTSKRGAEGWVRAVSEILRDRATVAIGPDWSGVPLWTVGSTSLDVFDTALSDPSINGRYIPRPSLAGHTAKSASTLIPHLLSRPPRLPQQRQHDPEETDPAYRPYLLIRGDKSMDEIPQALRGAKRAYRSITVYSTRARTDIPQTTLTVLGVYARPTDSPHQIDTPYSIETPHSADTAHRTASLWLAFFSPSSAAFALEHIHPNTLSSPLTRVFAIGETTAAWLTSKGITVHAMAEQPTPEGMIRALREAEHKGR